MYTYTYVYIHTHVDVAYMYMILYDRTIIIQGLSFENKTYTGSLSAAFCEAYESGGVVSVLFNATWQFRP